MPRAPKHCGRPGCTTIVTSRTYCAQHEAEAQAQQTARRGNFRERGYGTRHDREAKAAKAFAVANHYLCPRCGKPLLEGQPLDYGHTISRANDPNSRADRVEHAHCNRSAQHYRD